MTIEPNDLIKHAKLFTRWQYLNPNGWAIIHHLTGEYEDDDPEPRQKESHTFVTTFDPRKHWSAPLPPGAQECIQNELNQVEKYLDLTKTTQMPRTDQLLGDDFAETMKEQQARHVMQTQFTPPEPPPATETNTRNQQFEQLIESSPLAKIAQLQEDNWQQRIATQLDTIKQHLTPQMESHFLPTPPDTPPLKPSECF
jgi:hypothetical protein